jgi:hypothetical protein
MRAIGLVSVSLVMVTLLVTDAADAASNAWCASYKRGVRLPYKSRDKPPPNEQLPSIGDETQKQAEAEQSDIRKQLAHAQQQIALTKSYPGRE